MNLEKQENELLQWHPAIYSGLQIELQEDKDNLIFENEHQLSAKPMEIDVLIVKKEKALPVKKNIGRIFRMHNIIEYKSPTDYLSIDDFYKVYGYACFYKADTGNSNEILIDEITITFVSYKYPIKLINHLKKDRGYLVTEIEKGIYYVQGDYIPIQIIVASQLTEEQNLWLKNLTDHMDGTASAEKLIIEYEKHKNSNLYKAAMDIIVRANSETFKEVKEMCEALKELMKDELDAAHESGMQRGIECGMQRGMQRGMHDGQARVNTLNQYLIQANRTEDLLRSTTDEEYQEQLFQEFGI